MNGELTSSLAYLPEACASEAPDITRELIRPRALLAAGQALPAGAFGLYFHLASAIFDGDEAVARWAGEQFEAIAPRTPSLRMLGWGSADSADVEAALALRMGEDVKQFAPLPRPLRSASPRW